MSTQKINGPSQPQPIQPAAITPSVWSGIKVTVLSGAKFLGHFVFKYTGVKAIYMLTLKLFEKKNIGWGDVDAPWGRVFTKEAISSPSDEMSLFLIQNKTSSPGTVNAAAMCKVEGIDIWLPGVVIADFDRGWTLQGAEVEHNGDQTGSAKIFFDHLMEKVSEFNPEFSPRKKKDIVGQAMTAMCQIYGAGILTKLSELGMPAEDPGKEKSFKITLEKDKIVIDVVNPFTVMNDEGEIKNINTIRSFSIDASGTFTPLPLVITEG